MLSKEERPFTETNYSFGEKTILRYFFSEGKVPETYPGATINMNKAYFH